MERTEGPFAAPVDIQYFLNALPYNPKPECKSPARVLREGTAHCFEGALFAASRQRTLGYPPLLMDLRAENDDDHVIALFREKGCWGAVAKSNFTTLRYREPVYRTLRELAMSYFDFYFNVLREKTLRARSRPMKLEQFDSLNWMETDEDLEYIGDAFTKLSYYPLIEKGREESLSLADPDLVQAGLLGSNPAGLYVPKP